MLGQLQVRLVAQRHGGRAPDHHLRDGSPGRLRILLARLARIGRGFGCQCPRAPQRQNDTHDIFHRIPPTQ